MLFLRPSTDSPPESNQRGNLLLDALCGAKICYLPTQRSAQDDALRTGLAQLEAQGKRVYHVPLGGSNACGLWGYICAAEELLEQGLDRDFDDLVLAAGTGGTAAGLAIGLHLAGSRVRVHGVPVCNDAAYFYAHVDEYATIPSSHVHPLENPDTSSYYLLILYAADASVLPPFRSRLTSPTSLRRMLAQVWPADAPRPSATSLVRFIDGHKCAGYEATDASLLEVGASSPI